MFSLGFGEILIICVILIVVVGPERLPGLMKGVGKTMRTMRQASREIRSTIGIDELMRDDVMRPYTPPPRPPPAATVSRTDPQQPAPPAATPGAAPPAAGASGLPPAVPPPPAAAAASAAPAASASAGAPPAAQPGDSGERKG